MRLTVAAIGRLRSGPELELIEDYAGRIRAAGKPLGVSQFDIRECEAPKGLAGAARQAREADLLAGVGGAGAKRVALDEKGEILSSEEFARRIGRWRDDGAPEIAFLIGGPDGHDRSLVAKADLVIAFGRATFPHMLVRAMLVEQIYRAMTILSGHHYHRG
jgi:23S rRNA (pseudouridine1915-N3)-methyltransferase